MRLAGELYPQFKEQFNWRRFAGFARLGNEVAMDWALRETLRVSTYVQMEIDGSVDLGVDSLAAYVREQRKKFKISYVSMTAEAELPALKKDEPDDEKLTKWVEENGDGALKDDLQVAFDRIYLDFEQIDHNDFKDYTEDLVEPGDAEIKERYERDKQSYLIPKKKEEKKEEDKKEEDKGEEAAGDDEAVKKKAPETTKQDPQYKPLDEVRDEIKNKLLIENVMKGILADVINAHKDRLAAIQKEEEEKKKEEEEEEEEEKKKENEEGAAAKPGKDSDKKDSDKGAMQDNAKPPKADVDSAAKTEAFSLEAWFKEKFKSPPPGIEFIKAGKRKRPEAFVDLEKGGKWEGNWSLRTTSKKGDISKSIESVEKGCFIYQITDRAEQVVRDMKEIREDALEAYYKKESMDKCKERAEEFRKLIRTKAEELVKDEVAKAKAANEDKITAGFDKWKKKLENEIEQAQKELDSGSLPRRSITRRQEKIKKKNESLAKADEKREELTKEHEEEAEKALEKVIKSSMAAAFDNAAADKEGGAKILSLGPFFVDEKDGPRFGDREDSVEKFLKQDTLLLGEKADYVSDPKEDYVNKLWLVARIDSIEDGGKEAVTRKSLAEHRGKFSVERIDNVLNYGYRAKALKARFQYRNKEQGSLPVQE